MWNNESRSVRNTVTNFFVAGVGGQGALLASDVIAEVGLGADLDSKKSEIHGMAQRAGSVFSHVRWGQKVNAPVFGDGEADYFLAFEIAEALRWQHVLKQSGIAIVNKQKILPVAVAVGAQSYPRDGELEVSYAEGGQKLVVVDADAIAVEIGNIRVANSVILGVLSTFIDLPVDVWERALSRLVPAKVLSFNLEAFQRGRTIAY